ncbi:Adiponectin receptor protein [Phytophthora cinnamomi]|uniref:Adiponectin receptor protein n=1 Tax=Phytophthora cinnamomi TaxID=4785 RepID=UPI00355947EC|nr:Adiponectin receptor protein [Phytophthora cinnamomi]
METGHHMLLRSHSKKLQAPPKPQPQPKTKTPARPALDDAMASAGGNKLHTFERLHAEGFAYLADNSYIRSGYRLHYSARECFLSLFELHNETLNVWTHMVGSFIFLTLMLYLALSGHALAPAADTAALAGLTTPQAWCASAQPWMEGGRHMPRMLLASGVPDLCPPPTGRVAPAKYYEVASVIFDHSLHRLPSLERFHALVEQNVGGFSDSVGAQMELLRSELGALSARLGGQVRDAHSEQVRSLKMQLDQRVESLSLFLQDVASQVGADLPMKYALEELNGVADSVRNGLHILATVEGPHNVPHWPIFAFMASAVVCLTCSATFHLMFVVSRPAYMFLSRLDYAGITILIAGSFYPMIYYSFYCHPWLRTAYLASISTMAALTFTVALMPVFSTPKFLVARTCIFLALGFFGVVPVTHLVWHFGLFDPHVTVMIGPLLLMGLLYTSGAIIYATKFPERFYPGRFDLWFSSHQLWHVCVVAAALVHFANALQQYEWRWNTQCEA